MRLKTGVILVFCFSFISFISFISASVILEIQTLPGHEIYITEIDAYSSGNIAVSQPLHTFTGSRGKIELGYTPEKSTFKLGLLLKNGTRKVIGYRVLEENFHDGETVKIEFLPDGINMEDVLLLIGEEEEVLEDVEINESETNISASNESEIVELNETLEVGDLVEVETDEEENEEFEEIETNKSSEGVIKGVLMNGYAIYENNKFVVNIFSYFIGAVVLVAPVYMLLKKRRKKKKDSMIPDEGDEDELIKAEEELKKAQDKIDELSGKKIEDAKKKLIEDEKELMRLRNLKRKKKEE